MPVNEMKMSDIEKRMAEIRTEMNAESADIEALTKEVEAMEERKAQLIADEESRKALANRVAEGKEGTVTMAAVGESRKDKTDIELRDTAEYGKAFVKAIIGQDDTELRALLSTNVEGGVVPIPTILDNEIRNAWEDAQLLSLVKQTAYPGNVKVGFEYSASGAVVHVEGEDEPDEETLVLGTVELKAESIKKWITVSDEAIEGTTIDTLGYIYAELAQRIVEKAEEVLIAKINAAPASTTATAPGVPAYSVTALAVDTITMALAELSGKAKNIHLAMNRRTYAALIAAGKAANYSVDVFDGLKDKVVFTDALPAFSSATANSTVIIAGDFGYGAQANRPNGNALKITVDDKSLAEKDLVKVVGKQYVGIGVVAPKAFVKVKKVAAAG